jgi:hypothetical protein
MNLCMVTTLQSCPKWIGRDCDGIVSPARSMTTGCRQPAYPVEGCSACSCDIFQPPGMVTSARFSNSIGSNGSAASDSPLAGASV